MFNRKCGASEKFNSSSQSPKLDINRKKRAKLWGKLRNYRSAYSEERKKQRERLDKEIAGVNKLLKEGLISKDIHSRYLKMLEMSYAQKIQETRDKYGFANPKYTSQTLWRKIK